MEVVRAQRGYLTSDQLPNSRLPHATARYHPGMTDLQILLKAIAEDVGDPVG